MFIVLVKATQKMIGPFKTLEGAELYIKTNLNFLPDEATTIVRLSEP